MQNKYLHETTNEYMHSHQIVYTSRSCLRGMPYCLLPKPHHRASFPRIDDNWYTIQIDCNANIGILQMQHCNNQMQQSRNMG